VKREREAIIEVFDGIQRVSMKIVDWAMGLAPYGVGALMYSLTAKSGFAVIPRLGGYVVGITIDQLQGAPKYSNDNEWGWSRAEDERVYGFYKAAPYW